MGTEGDPLGIGCEAPAPYQIVPLLVAVLVKSPPHSKTHLCQKEVLFAAVAHLARGWPATEGQSNIAAIACPDWHLSSLRL